MALVSDRDIETLISTYLNDLPILSTLDRYHQGQHDAPFIPRHANAEYKLITSRCYTNFMRQAVSISRLGASAAPRLPTAHRAVARVTMRKRSKRSPRGP